jgi:hypothetical protein
VDYDVFEEHNRSKSTATEPSVGESEIMQVESGHLENRQCDEVVRQSDEVVEEPALDYHQNDYHAMESGLNYPAINYTPPVANVATTDADDEELIDEERVQQRRDERTEWLLVFAHEIHESADEGGDASHLSEELIDLIVGIALMKRKHNLSEAAVEDVLKLQLKTLRLSNQETSNWPLKFAAYVCFITIDSSFLNVQIYANPPDTGSSILPKILYL